MRQPRIILLIAASAAVLAACQDPNEAEVERAIEAVNAIDETNLNSLMLNSTDPAEAVAHFRRTSEANPDRIDLKRGLAISMVRNKQVIGALPVWREVVAHPEATNDDWLGYADALIRTGDWDGAAEALEQIPPTYETFRRYRLEAMVADSKEQWEKSDSFYEVAMGLTTQPSGVLNNWGYSKLVRGDFSGAERLFAEAITYDPDFFTAKNNYARARGLQRNYQLPVVRMTQVERAILLDTMAREALRNGDIEISKGLFREAIETHPQHFEEAVRSLRALEANVLN